MEKELNIEEHGNLIFELRERNPIIRCKLLNRGWKYKDLNGSSLVVTTHPRMVLVDKFGEGVASTCLKEFMEDKKLKEIELLV